MSPTQAPACRVVRQHKLASWIVFAVALAVYLALPTRDYYWDGISFAQNIEDAHHFSAPRLLQPNHLIYSATGWVLYQLVHVVAVSPRALQVLAFSNSILSALAAVVLFEILFSLSRSFYLSSVFSLLFAFSATWWKFSTDADAYVPSVLLLLVCFALILPSKRGRPKLLGLAHAGAMLFHELALFFYPVAVAGILLQRGETSRQRLCRLAEYTSLTALVVGSAYWLAFSRVEPNGCFSAFGRWITYHDPSVGFAFNLGRDAIRSFRGNIHLLVATRFSAGAHHPAASVAIAVSGLLLLLLGYKVARYWRDLRDLSRTTVAADTRIILLALLWIVPYTAFLFFWLPQNTFYRLFYLPGVIILLCALAAPREHMTATPRRNRAALLVAVVALTNFALEILPHAPASENPTLVFAAELQKRWPAGTVVYCRSFSTNITDWTIRYFNPQTEWRAVAAGSVPVSEPELLSIYEHGHAAWFEPTALQLAADCDASAFHNWLEEHTRPGTTLADKTGGIRFVQVVPAATSSQGRGGVGCIAKGRAKRRHSAIRFAYKRSTPLSGRTESR